MPEAKVSATSSPKKIPSAAAKKPAAPKAAAAKPAAAKKPEAAPKAKKVKGNGITPEERYLMIAEAAYYRAESRGFVGGDPARDWVEAEAEIKMRLGEA